MNVFGLILAQEDAAAVAEFANRTTVHPLGLLIVLACAAAILVVPRRYACWPMIVIACFVGVAQRLVVGGLDFNFLRILVIAGALRILVRNESSGVRWGRLDTLLIWFAVVM